MNPFAWMRGRAGCLRGVHERSIPGVHYVEQQTRSHCRFCGIPLLRKAKRRWVTIDGLSPTQRLEWGGKP